MSANPKLRKREYETLQEKGTHFVKSDEYPDNCIKTSYEFDQWFARWEQFSKTRKYKAYFRGMSEAKYKLFSSAQRLWMSEQMEEKKRQAPGLDYKDFVIKFVEAALNDDTLLAKVFDLYGIKGTCREFPCLSILQHYHAPTPLLDWTYNFKVALFFAAEHVKAPAMIATNELDDYFAIYVITEETYRVTDIEYKESVASCFPPPTENAHTGQLYRLTDVNLDVPFKIDEANPFKDKLMVTIYNQHIIPQEGLFIFNPHPELSMDDLFNEEYIKDIPVNETNLPHSSFMVYNIHKSLGEYVKEKIAAEGYTKDYIMPDLTTYASSIKGKVLNGLL
jgi:hypothetical protein